MGRGIDVGSPLCGSWILFVREEEERRAARARCEVEASDSYDRLRGGLRAVLKPQVTEGRLCISLHASSTRARKPAAAAARPVTPTHLAT